MTPVEFQTIIDAMPAHMRIRHYTFVISFWSSILSCEKQVPKEATKNHAKEMIVFASHLLEYAQHCYSITN